MAKALRTAAVVVGAVALVATGVGAIAGAAALAGTGLGISAATLATVATVAKVASFAAAGLSLAAAATAGKPKGSVGGNPTKFKIDKEAGIPIAFGRTWSGGNVVHRQYYNDPKGKKNLRESWVTVHSLGPVRALGSLQIDKVPVAFNAQGAATGTYSGYMWLDSQLGACPEARALRGPSGNFAGWGSTSKLSGLAADLWTLQFDTKGEVYPNGTPQRGRLIEGVLAWDPRLDSTYPGGSGPCRRDNPATHVWTQNMWILALQFALGFMQNGLLMAGGGLPINGVDVNPFVQAANTADANGWTAGGIVYTTADNDWDILKMLAQAGAGEVFSLGGVLTCTHSAPRVSLGTIGRADIMGTVVAPSTASKRQRRNTIIPRVRLESHGWEVVPLDPVSVPAYVAVDNGRRPQEIEYPLIQAPKQGAEVAMYDMLNARELEPISLPCKLYTIGYLPGDCVTLDIADANLVGRDVVLRTRELDMATAGVTFTARSEDPAKHPFALGATATPPPTPDLSVPGLELSAPAGWTATAVLLEGSGLLQPAIVIGGAVDNGAAEAVEFAYRVAGSGEWTPVGGIEDPSVTRAEIRSLAGGAIYDVSIRYRVRGVWGERLVIEGIQAPAGEAAYDDGTSIDDLRPADPGATVGAPPGTSVGGRPSEEVVTEIDRLTSALQTTVILYEELEVAVEAQDGRITSARGVADAAAAEAARAHTRINSIVAAGDGDFSEIEARISTIETVNVDQGDAIALVRNIVEAGSNSNAQLRATLNTQALAIINGDQAIADQITTLRGAYGGNLAQMSDRITTVSDAQGASAQRTTALEASRGGPSNSINPNPDFTDWSGNPLVPTGWAPWGQVAPGSWQRVGGADALNKGGYAIEHTPASTNSGFVTQSVYVGIGWYVLEATVWRTRATWNGSCATLNGEYTIDFMADPYSAGRTGDSNGDGGVRSWSKLVQVTAAGYKNWHLMGNWEGLDRAFSDKTLRWLRCAVRTATDAEVRAMKADATLNNPGGVLARLNSEEFARTTALAAEAGRITSAIARVDSTESRLDIVEQAVADGDGGEVNFQIAGQTGDGRFIFDARARSDGSRLLFGADEVLIAAPVASGFMPVARFVEGEVRIYGRLMVNSLAAISAELGTLTSTAPTGHRVVRNGLGASLFLPNGNLKMRWGVWGV